MTERNKFQIATDDTNVRLFREGIRAVADTARERGLTDGTISDELLELAAELQAFNITSAQHWFEYAEKRIESWRQRHDDYVDGVRELVEEAKKT